MRVDANNKPSQTIKVKILLLLLSLVFFTLLSSFPMALAILSTIFVHESGHLWAARKIGMPTRGIYFLPGIGGVALIEDLEIVNRENECFISIMGPIWGGLYALSFILFSKFTGILWFSEAGLIMAAINLVNLVLPINPLDGGRILKSIAFSIHRRFGMVVNICMIPIALFLSMRYHIWILSLVALLCFLEFRHNECKKDVDITNYLKRKTGEDFPSDASVTIKNFQKKPMNWWGILKYSALTIVVIHGLFYMIIKSPSFIKHLEDNASKEVVKENSEH